MFTFSQKKIDHTVDNDVRDAGRKIKTGHKDDESYILILEEGEEREITFVEKAAVPTVFAERISEDVSEDAAEEEYGRSCQCQVQPQRITGFG